jgi:hypothetical protein
MFLKVCSNILYNKAVVYKEAQDAIIAGFCQEDFYPTHLRHNLRGVVAAKY